MYDIQKGVSMPNLSVPFVRKYPFCDMAVGDSFVIENDFAQTCRNAASMHGRRNNMKFSVRKDSNGAYRCWRVS